MSTKNIAKIMYFAETEKSLAELIQTTLETPSVTTGCMYTESQIIAKIDFVMTDSTSHNVGVIQMVCEEVEMNVFQAP